MGFAGDNNTDNFLFTWAASDSISITENGHFLTVYIQSLGATETARQSPSAGKALVLTSSAWTITGESIDPASTNTLFFRINLISTTTGYTIDDTVGTGTISITDFEVIVPINTRFNMIWSSDSVGTINLRGFSIGGHFQ